MGEQVDLDGSGNLAPIRDGNGAPYGAAGGTRLLASGGLRGELDMLKVLIAGADGLVEGTIGKAAAFGCTQCGNCHLDCSPRRHHHQHETHRAERSRPHGAPHAQLDGAQHGQAGGADRTP